MEFTKMNPLALSESEKSQFLGRTYGWMALALLISAVAAYFTANSRTVMMALFGTRFGFMILAIGEIALVWWLTASIRKISVEAATIAFLVYSVLNGVTLSSIFFVYRISSIAASFFGCSAMFLTMSFYGTTTKRDLTSFGKYLMMGLIGIIITSLVQFVLGMILHTGMPKMLDLLISFATVIIFTGLTAYDAQKVIRTAEQANGSDDYKKVAILGALELYLDFINLFLALLRIFGKRK